MPQKPYTPYGPNRPYGSRLASTKTVKRIGQRYGSMVVLERAGSAENGDALWKCQCDCGKTVIKRGHNLPKVKSCGNTCTATWSTELPLIREEGEPFGIIYKLTNKKDGKIYIGQTVFSLEHRWKRHIEYAKRGGEGYLQKAIRMYGPESFTQEQIAVAYDKHQLDELEKHYILTLDTLNSEIGYNQTWRPSQDEESRQTMSEKNSGENNPAYRDEIDDEHLLDLYNQGMSLTKIEKFLGFPRSTVGFRLKKLGINIKPQPNAKDLPDDEIIAEYKNGASVSALARKYKVSNWSIHSRLKKAGLKIEQRKVKSSLKREDVSTETLAAQYNAGIKISDLARIHKMDRKTIRTRLQQIGIELKKNANKLTTTRRSSRKTSTKSTALDR